MLLKVSERLCLMDLFPKEWDYALFCLKEELMKKLSFTEDEFKEFNIKKGGEIFIDENNKEIPVQEGTIMYIDMIVEIDFTEMEKELFKKELEKLEKSQMLNDKNIIIFIRAL